MRWEITKGQVATRIGQVGPVRAEWGWGGVGHALGFNSETRP